ncbi:MAG: uL30 family ribosomal protein [Nanoarchaeota archaeon]|nr:uL30 family ribosomal protein [Nanoarchaeota archaeon]
MEKPTKTQKAKETENNNDILFGVVRVRGEGRSSEKVKDTLAMLHLYKRNFCVVLKNTPENKGMLEKVKDMITWGEIDDETLKLLKEKRDQGKKYFRLNPPRKGFERKGIKVSFKAGGALGYRGEKINGLLKRMI